MHDHLTCKHYQNISPEFTSSEKLTAVAAFAKEVLPLSRMPDRLISSPFIPDLKSPTEKPAEQPVMNYSNYLEVNCLQVEVLAA